MTSEEDKLTKIRRIEGLLLKRRDRLARRALSSRGPPRTSLRRAALDAHNAALNIVAAHRRFGSAQRASLARNAVRDIKKARGTDALEPDDKRDLAFAEHQIEELLEEL